MKTYERVCAVNLMALMLMHLSQKTELHQKLPWLRISIATLAVSNMLAVSPPVLAQSQAEAVNQPSTVPWEESFSPNSRPILGQYTLGPDDRVQLDIVGLPEYTGELEVLADGTVGLPLIGSTFIQGMTLRQAERELSTQLSYYLKNPLVTLRLVQARSIDIAVAGEVNRPGTYSITPNLPADDRLGDSQPTVTEAIQMAGGITQIADIRNIQIRRSEANSDRPHTLTTNLWKILQDGEIQEDLTLRDGDVIFIPTATELSASEIDELSSASFAPATVAINVVGEVDNPGRVEIAPNTPLNQVILAAGGFNERAGGTTVELVRLNSNGTATRRTIDVDFSQGIDEANNPPLREGDTVIVERTQLATTADSFGIVSPIVTPLLLLLDLFN